MSGALKRYRYEVVRDCEDWHYVIFEGDREVLRSGGFHLHCDADACGRHFAADNDLEATIRRRTDAVSH